MSSNPSHDDFGVDSENEEMQDEDESDPEQLEQALKSRMQTWNNFVASLKGAPTMPRPNFFAKHSISSKICEFA